MAETAEKLADGFTPEALATKDAEALARDWLLAKDAEDRCKAWRTAVEEALDGIFGHPEEGSKTHKAGTLKVTMKGVLYRKMDWDKWDGVKAKVPEELRPTKMVEELDEEGVKWLAEHRPDVYQVVAQAITTKPGKVGVTVKGGAAC